MLELLAIKDFHLIFIKHAAFIKLNLAFCLVVAEFHIHFRKIKKAGSTKL